MSRLRNPIRYLLLASMVLFSALASAELETIYYHNDHLGNPVAATNATGELMWQEEFTPYGTRQINQDGGLNQIWYTGKELDEDTGLVYFGARWYDPSIGQFLSVDPVGVIPGNRFSYNRYAYANNNPQKYIDPDGDFAQLVWGGLGGAAFDLALQGLAIASGTQDDFSWGQLAASTLVGAGTGGLSLGTKTVSIKRALDARKATKGAAPIAKQKQAGHIKGTPQNANRQKANKPTSTFFGEKSGERLTQGAFQKGTPVPGRPGVKDHDFGVSVGTGPKGGMQTKVRVHQDKKGRIHGHPSGPERF
jgi:RHS repeat-associated protein